MAEDEKPQTTMTVEQVKDALQNQGVILSTPEIYDKAVAELEDEGVEFPKVIPAQKKIIPEDTRNFEQLADSEGVQHVSVFYDPQDPVRFFNAAGGTMRIKFPDDTEIFFKAVVAEGDVLEGYLMRRNGEFERDPDNPSLIMVRQISRSDIMEVTTVHIRNGEIHEGSTPGELDGRAKPLAKNIEVVRNLDDT